MKYYTYKLYSNFFYLMLIFNLCSANVLLAKKRRNKVKQKSQADVNLKLNDNEVFVEKDKLKTQENPADTPSDKKPSKLFLRPTAENENRNTNISLKTIATDPIFLWSNITLLSISAVVTTLSAAMLLWSAERINAKAENQLLIYPKDRLLVQSHNISLITTGVFLTSTVLFVSTTILALFYQTSKTESSNKTEHTPQKRSRL